MNELHYHKTIQCKDRDGDGDREEDTVGSDQDERALPAPEDRDGDGDREEDTVGSDQDESPEPTPAEQPDSGDEWDTDLEADEQDRRGRLVSPTELYLVACRLTAVIPCSYVLRQLASTTLDLNQQGTLDLNHHGLGPLGAKALAITLLSDVQISNLELKDNHLLAEGIGYLMEMLKENFTIQSLVRNGFIDADARSLADALAALGEALRHNNTLVHLDLSNNRVSDEGTALLCNGLLAHNPLTQLGALNLLNTIRNNPKSALEEINISTVLVNEAFVVLLEAVCQNHSGLEVQFKGVTGSVTRTKKPSIALNIIQDFLTEEKEGLLELFQSLDKEGNMSVDNKEFRKAVQHANIPLDQHQLEWLIQNFDKDCTGRINYSEKNTSTEKTTPAQRKEHQHREKNTSTEKRTPAQRKEHQHSEKNTSTEKTTPAQRKEHQHSEKNTSTEKRTPAQRKEHQHSEKNTSTEKTTPAQRKEHQHREKNTSTEKRTPAQRKEHQHREKNTSTEKRTPAQRKEHQHREKNTSTEKRTPAQRKEHQHREKNTSTEKRTPAQRKEHQHRENNTSTEKTTPAQRKEHQHREKNTSTEKRTPAQRKEHQHRENNTNTEKTTHYALRYKEH
ncbi:unnamed protein product [Coregonus sp. 'balchen']|nr:unnamed protein product [Coregonus sp. 'balchen']